MHTKTRTNTDTNAEGAREIHDTCIPREIHTNYTNSYMWIHALDMLVLAWVVLFTMQVTHAAYKIFIYDEHGQPWNLRSNEMQVKELYINQGKGPQLLQRTYIIYE